MSPDKPKQNTPDGTKTTDTAEKSAPAPKSEPSSTPTDQKESAKTVTQEKSREQRAKLRESVEDGTKGDSTENEEDSARKTINDPASLAKWRKKQGFKEYSPQTIKEESSTLYLINQGLEGNFTPEKVKEKMAEYNIQVDSKTMEALSNPVNLGVIEQVAKEIGFEYLINSDADLFGKLGEAKEYFTKLAEDLQSKLLEKVISLYEENKDRFDSQLQMIEKFSEFTGLDFVKYGILKKDGVKKLMTLEPSAYESLFNDFSAHLKNEKEMESKQSELGKIKGVAPTTPEAKSPDITADTGGGETAEQQTEKENAEKEAEQAMVTAIEQAEASKEAEKAGGDTKDFDISKFKTGIDFIDKLLAKPFIAKIVGPIIAIFMGGKADKQKTRFESLGVNEKTQAEAFEKALIKAGINIQTIAPLFENDSAIKLILNSRKKSNLPWKEFIEQRLDTDEISKLKSPGTLKASAILKLFL